MEKLPDFITTFMKTFHNAGYEIYVVGGAVRDFIMKKPVTNWDFATNATPEKIMKLFPQSFYNNDFGTVGINIKVGEQSFLCEVTPFRKEGQYKDLRHPETIEWAESIKEDLSRRDFTINAMAYDGERLLDPFGGKKDIGARQIVAVGDPDKRFTEDALRLMRAVRFTSQLGFMLEDKTRESIQKNAHLISHISWERIRDEFLKMLASLHPADGILFMKNTGLLTFVLPEVDVCFIIPQKSPNRHHIYDVGTHLIMALKNCPSSDPIVRFASLIHDIGKAETFRRDNATGQITFYNHEVVGTKQAEQIAERFKLSNKQKEKLVQLVKYHQFTVTELQTDKTIRRFIREVGLEYLNDLLDVRTADRIGSGATPTSWRLELFKKRLVEVQKIPFQVKDLKVSGNDVMKLLKIKSGPEVGRILNSIFNDVEEGRVKNEKDILMKKIKEYASSE